MLIAETDQMCRKLHTPFVLSKWNALSISLFCALIFFQTTNIQLYLLLDLSFWTRPNLFPESVWSIPFKIILPVLFAGQTSSPCRRCGSRGEAAVVTAKIRNRKINRFHLWCGISLPLNGAIHDAASQSIHIALSPLLLHRRLRTLAIESCL